MNQEANTQPFTKIGQIARSHGLKGELKVDLDFNDPEFLNEVTLVYLQNDRGDYFPARVSGFRVEKKGSNNSFFVQFDHIADRSAAEALRGRRIFAETSLAETILTDESEELSLVDFRIIDEHENEIGFVLDVMDIPGNNLISVSTGRFELLIPLVDEYVNSIDWDDQTIYCQHLNRLEEGLYDED